MTFSDTPAEIIRLLAPYLTQGRETLSEATAQDEAADLEISLHRRQSSVYSVETRFIPPGSAIEQRLGANEIIEIAFDLRENERTIGWLLFQMDMDCTKTNYDVDEEGVRNLQS